MILQAMYIGKQPIDLKARVKNGEELPPFKGTNYIFLVNEWYEGGEVEETYGRHYIDRRETGDEIRMIEQGALKIGDLTQVSIRNKDLNVSYYCQFAGDKEPENKEGLPF